jgi:hypothetical protein
LDPNEFSLQVSIENEKALAYDEVMGASADHDGQDWDDASFYDEEGAGTVGAETGKGPQRVRSAYLHLLMSRAK